MSLLQQLHGHKSLKEMLYFFDNFAQCFTGKNDRLSILNEPSFE